MKEIKRTIGILLICCLAAVLLPMSALAEGGADLGYTTIGGVIFNKDCTMLVQYPMNSDATTYRIPDGVTTIGESAFANNHTLEEVIFPDSLTTIGDGAFYDCGGILNYHLPNSVTTIGEYAFARCRNWMSLDEVEPFYIPAGVTSIGAGAFDDRPVKEFVVDSNNKSYTAIDGVLFSKDRSVLLAYPIAKSETSYTVPAGVKRIENSALANTHFESISFPDGLISIGNNAFYRADVANLDLPDTVTTIGAAFWQSEIGSITIPAGVTYIEASAFSMCFDVDIYFKGTQEQWNQLSNKMNDEDLEWVTVHILGSESALSFSDVRSEDYFYAPVRWAVEQGITTGTGANTFSPDKTCTRAEILTFLWRSLGSPEPNPIYAYYGKDAYYAQAAAWAIERHWIEYFDFDISAPCTRLEAVEYIWKCAGSPDAPSASFSDVSSKAVDWALSKGVTNGTSATTFSPADTCTRGQIVTFLYRALS